MGSILVTIGSSECPKQHQRVDGVGPGGARWGLQVMSIEGVKVLDKGVGSTASPSGPASPLCPEIWARVPRSRPAPADVCCVCPKDSMGPVSLQ